MIYYYEMYMHRLVYKMPQSYVLVMSEKEDTKDKIIGVIMPSGMKITLQCSAIARVLK